MYLHSASMMDCLRSINLVSGSLLQAENRNIVNMLEN